MQRDVTVNTDSSTPVGSVRPGVVLGARYRLDDLIAQGATAQVFRGTDELLGRQVAVKVFGPAADELNSVERRRVEVEVLASLNDPHLVTVFDARMNDLGRRSARPTEISFVVMELVEGPTLAEEICAGPVCVARVAEVGLGVAAALDTMHRRGLVHRDVKPANILSTRDGSVKLGDFGLARVLSADARVTSAPMIMGTAAFFSPEQASGQDIEAPSDVYSLGLVLLEALTGRREYPGSPVESAVARILRGPVIPPDLPTPWPDLLAAMTSANPAARPTAGAVCAALASPTLANQGEGGSSRATDRRAPRSGNSSNRARHDPAATIAFPPRSTARPRTARLAMAALSTAAAVMLAAVLLLSHPRGTDPADPIGSAPPTGSSSSESQPTSAVSATAPSKTDAQSSRRSAPTTTARPAPTTKPASPARAQQGPAATVNSPVGQSDSAPTIRENVSSAAAAATTPEVGRRADTANDKGQSKSTVKADQQGKSQSMGKGKGNGKGKQKSNQP